MGFDFHVRPLFTVFSRNPLNLFFGLCLVQSSYCFVVLIQILVV